MQYSTQTDNPPRTAQPQPDGVHRAGFESILPPEALDELLRRKLRTRQQSAKTKWFFPPWLRSTLTFGASALTLALLIAAIAGIMLLERILDEYIVVAGPSERATPVPKR
jgi:hypothetical protein